MSVPVGDYQPTATPQPHAISVRYIFRMGRHPHRPIALVVAVKVEVIPPSPTGQISAAFPYQTANFYCRSTIPIILREFSDFESTFHLPISLFASFPAQLAFAH